MAAPIIIEGNREKGRDERMAMESVPVIDLTAARAGGAADRLAAARAIDTACREIGFFTITGHGVPQSAAERLRTLAHRFFALPLKTKLAAQHPENGTPRGYHAIAAET